MQQYRIIQASNRLTIFRLVLDRVYDVMLGPSGNFIYRVNCIRRRKPNAIHKRIIGHYELVSLSELMLDLYLELPLDAG